MPIRPSQLLACKAKGCQPSNRSAPGIVEQLGESARRRFAQVLQCLREARIGYEVDPTLLVDDGVATHTVFEVRCPESPQGRPLATGSRRDGVVAALDGPQVGAVGFTIDCDRVLAVLEEREHPFPGPAEREAVFVAPILASDVAAAFALAHELRAHGIAADGDFEERPLKALFKHVDKRGTRLVLTVATGPAGEPAIKLHDRPADTQVELAKDAVVEALRQRLRE
jgi:histidyl-tRNA synthetase